MRRWLSSYKPLLFCLLNCRSFTKPNSERISESIYQTQSCHSSVRYDMSYAFLIAVKSWSYTYCLRSFKTVVSAIRSVKFTLWKAALCAQNYLGIWLLQLYTPLCLVSLPHHLSQSVRASRTALVSAFSHSTYYSLCNTSGDQYLLSE